MSLVKCKCGRYTNNGLMCTSCQKDSSIDVVYYAPDEVEEEELDEYGFTLLEWDTMYDSNDDD